MASKHSKKWSTMRIINSETPWYTFWIVKTKTKLLILSVGKNVEWPELLSTAGVNLKWYNHFQEKLKVHTHTYSMTSHCAPSYFPKSSKCRKGTQRLEYQC